MKSLLKLHFKLLPLAAHFDYFKKLSAILATESEALKAAIATLMPDFNTWLAKENAVMNWVRKNALTAKIAKADEQVDRALVTINAYLEVGLHSPVAATVELANYLFIMVKGYGRMASMSYDEEAGNVRSLLEQLKGPYATAVADMGMTTFVTDLENAFNTFESLLRQREDEQAGKPTCTAKDARKGVEDAYQQMVYIIDANAAVGTDASFAAFIDKLNPDIKRLNEEFHHAKKDISAGEHTVVEPIPTQPYTEKPVTVVPNVYYREDGKPTVQLSLGADFTVTYKNNIKVGTAELTIHGKGAYKGQFTVTFNIAR
jgi:hypothetical protein